MLGGAARKLGAAAGRPKQIAEDARPVGRIVPVDEHPRDAVAHGRDQPAHRGRHHRRAARLRLQRDQAERLVVARHADQVGGPVDVGQVGRRPRRQEPHAVARGRATAASSISAVGPVQAGAARAAADRDDQAGRPAAGSVAASSAAALSRTSRSLQRLDPPDERHDVAVLGQAEALPRRSPRSAGRRRREAVEVDAGRAPRPPGRVGAPYRSISSRASVGVLATSRSASATTCSSPITRAFGSGVSPSASSRFLTFASVCAVCTSGTPQRSLASQPTCPDSQ